MPISKCYLHGLIGSIITVVLMKDSIGHHLKTFQTEANVSVCITKPCIRAAATILQNLDPKMNPCQDFYSYACGGFEKSNYVITEKDPPFLFALAQENMMGELKFLLKTPTAPDDPIYLKAIKSALQSCLDLDRLKELGIKPLEEMLLRITSWPLLSANNWQEDSYDWLNISSLIMKDFLTEPFLILHFNDKGNLEFQSLEFLNAEWYCVSDSEHELRKAYEKYMTSALQLFTNESVTEVIEDVIEIMSIVSNRSREEFENRPETISDLYNISDSVDWLSFFQRYYPETTNETRIEIKNMDRPEFEGWINVLNSVSTRTLANFQFWSLIHKNAEYIEGPLANYRNEYLRLLERFIDFNFEDSSDLRWEHCLKSLKPGLRFGIVAHYLQRFITEETVEMLMEVSEDIRNEAKITFSTLEGIDEERRKTILEIIDNLIFMNPCPRGAFNISLVEAFYENLTLDKDNFFDNVFKLKSFALTKEEMDNTTMIGCKICDELIDGHFFVPPNIIGIPLSGLKSVFFNTELPKYLIFGDTGATLGHEVTHAVTSLYEEELVEMSVSMSPKELLEMISKKPYKCLIDLYNKNRLPYLQVTNDGLRTLNENAADHTGVNISRKAYETWVKEHGTEPQLPGLEFSPQQLFWLSFANVWCRVDNRESIMTYVSDEHSHSRYRVLNTLTNLPQFAEDFNCPVGSPMNPVERCSIWN